MTYLYISIILCGIFAVVGYFVEKKMWINPITIFSVLWGVILLFSSMEEYTLHVADDEINLAILLGIISFIVGYFFNKAFFSKMKFSLVKHEHPTGKNVAYKSIPRYQLLYVLGAICLVYAIYSFINTVRQSGTLNLGTIQAMLQGGEIVSNNNAIVSAIALLVITPIRFVLPAITAVDFWFGKRDRKLLVITVCLILINALTSANRTTFLLFFIWLIIVAQIYLYHNKKKKNKNYTLIRTKHFLSKIKKRIRVIAIIAIIAFFILTLSRGVSLIYRQLYLYFAIPPRMFEIWAEKVEVSNIYGYGVASLLGFIYPICYVMRSIIGIDMPQLVQSIYDWTMLTDSTWVWPGTNITANAYVSVFWFLYLDYRVAGIIIGMFILGFISSRAFMNATKRTYSEKQICVYCCIFYIVLFSFVRMQFTQMRIALGLLFILFFAYKKVPINKKRSSL
ncbi:MAG TPA: hypothetical protein DCS12_07520 [Clostridiales bacterium]|nr:hypothetical protein [Clostridiales bacterium]